MEMTCVFAVERRLLELIYRKVVSHCRDNGMKCKGLCAEEAFALIGGSDSGVRALGGVVQAQPVWVQVQPSLVQAVPRLINRLL